MVHYAGDLDEALAAAAGDDPALLAELRAAFVDSLGFQIDLLGRARCDGNWRVAALRLQGLGASFHSGALIALAEQALDAVPGDPAIVRRLKRLHQTLADGG